MSVDNLKAVLERQVATVIYKGAAKSYVTLSRSFNDFDFVMVRFQSGNTIWNGKGFAIVSSKVKVQYADPYESMPGAIYDTMGTTARYSTDLASSAVDAKPSSNGMALTLNITTDLVLGIKLPS